MRPGGAAALGFLLSALNPLSALAQTTAAAAQPTGTANETKPPDPAKPEDKPAGASKAEEQVAETKKQLEGVAKQLEEVAQAQKKANERLDKLAEAKGDDDEAKSASRFIQYGVTLGAAYTVAFDAGGDARIHGLQSAGFTGYIAAFPAYWFSSAGANAYCAGQWSASETAIRAAEAEASAVSTTLGKQLDGLKKWLGDERDELKQQKQSAHARLIASAGSDAKCADNARTANALNVFCEQVVKIPVGKDVSALAALADFAFYQHLETLAERELDELARYNGIVAKSRRRALKNLLESAEDQLAELQNDTTVKPVHVDAVHRKAPGKLAQAKKADEEPLGAEDRAGLSVAFRSAFLERATHDTSYALREEPVQHPALCLPNKVGTYVGVSAPFDATVYLANVPDGGLVRRKVSPAFSVGGVLAPNALFSVLGGVSFGQVDRETGETAKGTEPIVMGTIGIGGNLDLVSVFR